MKLIGSKKNDAKKRAQELYPKVKTFSSAYDYSPAKRNTADEQTGYSMPFRLDERPYAVTPVPASIPERAASSSDINNPERIDLQDTMLTDESFAGRPPRHHQPEPEDKSAASGAFEDSGMDDEPETDDKPEASVLDVFSEQNSYDGYEPFYQADPETGYETEPLYTPAPEEESQFFPETPADTGTDCLPEIDPEAYDENDPLYEPGAVAAGPHLFSDPAADLQPDKSEGSDPLSFKKKKYAVAVGEKTNLKKKLKSRPKGSLKWKSSDKKIAGISKKGVLKPKKKGKVTVRVKTKNGRRAKVQIRIRPKSKSDSMPWESLLSGKKSSGNKKRSYYA